MTDRLTELVTQRKGNLRLPSDPDRTLDDMLAVLRDIYAPKIQRPGYVSVSIKSRGMKQFERDSENPMK